MASGAYTIHRAINRPMTFRGLKGQYILIAAVGLVGDLLLFILLYCAKIPPWLCIAIAFGLGAGLLWTCTDLSQRYGVHGHMKKRARRRVPSHLRCRSRNIFLHLKK